MAVQEEEKDRRLSLIGRIAAVAALVLAFVAVGFLLLGGGDKYTVKARFQAATQVVNGNLVQVAGRPVGLVKSVELSENGEAELELEIDEEFAPLRRGTQATLRIASLSGVVNRYVDLRIPSGNGPKIEEGGVIPATETTSAVDLDQLFNLFDDDTKQGLKSFIRGNALAYSERGEQANAGWRYLNPSLVGATRLFRELNRDSDVLEDFLVSSSNLVTDLADRRDDLALLVDKLADTTGAIARKEGSLETAISELPPFMRRANSTFVNLRATLDDLDPLVAESKPVTPKLRKVLAELKPFAQDATPTIRDLADLVKRPGKSNDLIELGKSILPFRDITIGPVQRNGQERPGSFPAAVESLRGQTPRFAFFRPYLVDFTGWIDDFSHSGIYDANGSASRVATSVNAFAAVGSQLKLVPEGLRDELGNLAVARGQNNRCPGSTERKADDGSNPWKPANIECDISQVPPGS